MKIILDDYREVAMNDVVVEQIVKVRQPGVARVYKAVMIVLALVSLTLLRVLVGYGVVLTACFVVFTFLLFKYYDAEYEYELVDGSLSVDRIMARTYRKHCGDYDVNKLEIMARKGSEKIAYRENGGKTKTFDYTSNTDSDNVYVMYLPSNNEGVRVLIEPDDRLLAAIRQLGKGKVYDA